MGISYGLLSAVVTATVLNGMTDEGEELRVTRLWEAAGRDMSSGEIYA